MVTGAGISFTEGLVSVVIAKTALVTAHMLFLVLAIGLAVSRPGVSRALLDAMLVLTGIGIVAVVGFVAAQHWGLLGAGQRGLEWLGVRRELTPRLRRVDEHLTFYYRARRRRLALSILFHFLGYLGGGLEVWLGLYLLGSPVAFADATIVEAFSSAIRSASFFVPASLGIQEGAFVGVFGGLGLRPEAGLAYGLVRRLREAAWAAAGYACLAMQPGPAPGFRPRTNANPR